MDRVDLDDRGVVVDEPGQLGPRPAEQEVALLGADAEVAAAEPAHARVEGVQRVLVAGEVVATVALRRDAAERLRGRVLGGREERGALGRAER